VHGLEDAVDAHKGDPRFGELDAGTFVGLLLDGILDGYHDELEAIERDVDRVDEAALRREPTDEILKHLVSIRRRTAILRRSLAPQRAVYQTLARPIAGQGSPIGAPWPELIDRLEHTIDAVERAHELLVGSFDIVMARTGQRTNDIVRVLTVISSVLLPSVVIAGIMGMNFHPSFFDQPTLFYGVLLVMVLLAAGSLLVARLRRWI
jgi:magnesium transporter